MGEVRRPQDRPVEREEGESGSYGPDTREGRAGVYPAVGGAEAVAVEEPKGRGSRCRGRLPCGLAGGRRAGAGS